MHPPLSAREKMPKLSEAEARRLSGDGVTARPWSQATPPNTELLSRSEGDLNRNSYRPSQYERLATRAVVNDDGTAIAEETNRMLGKILEELQRLTRALEKTH